MSCHKMSSCPANVCRLFHGCLTALGMSDGLYVHWEEMSCPPFVETCVLTSLNGDTQPGIVCKEFCLQTLCLRTGVFPALEWARRLHPLTVISRRDILNWYLSPVEGNWAFTLFLKYLKKLTLEAGDCHSSYWPKVTTFDRS